MTILIGAHLDEGLVIMADSRGTAFNESNKINYFRDDLQKVFLIGPYVVGIAGDAFTGFEIIKYLILKFNNNYETFSGTPISNLRLDILQSCKNVYEEMNQDEDNKPSVTIILSGCNNLKNMENPEFKKQYKNESDISISSVLPLSISTENNSFMLTLTFPSGDIHDVDKGEYISIGSGKIFEEKISNMGATQFKQKDSEEFRIKLDDPNNKNNLFEENKDKTIDELWTRIAARVTTFFVKNKDETFNSIMHGYAMGSLEGVMARHVDTSNGLNVKLQVEDKYTFPIASFLESDSDCRYLVELSALCAAFYSKKWLEYLNVTIDSLKKKLTDLHILDNGCIYFIGMTYSRSHFWVLDFEKERAFRLVIPQLQYDLSTGLHL